MKSHELTIQGMTCGHCVMHVKQALDAVDGLEVEDVQIGRARVWFDDEKVAKVLSEKVEEAGYNHIETLTLPVEGMTCASCVARVEKTLKKIDGVEIANVNLATEAVALSFDSSRTSLDILAKAVEGAGYKLALPAKSSVHGRFMTLDQTTPTDVRSIRVGILLSCLSITSPGILDFTVMYFPCGDA